MTLLDLIFPKNCLECVREGKYICDNCLGKVRTLKPVCPYCEKASIDGFTHSKCKKRYGLDGLTSIWKYEGVIRKAILALKFKYSTEVGKELASSFIRELMTRTDLVREAVLVPVPLYWCRENMRGFNQSEEIGKIVAKEIGWKFVHDFLVKKKSTASQVELSVEERKQNLKGAFAVNPIHGSLFVSHAWSVDALANLKSVIIFDDVFTTGSTLHEAAKALKHAGALRVWGMTIAR